jgi:hypothetical protein
VKFSCCDPRRLEVLEHGGSANAIEFLEVLDHAAPPPVPRQRTLFVRLLKAGFGPVLAPENIRITGGERIRTVPVLWCAPADDLPPEAEPGLVDGVDDLPRTLVVRTEFAGDFSLYTLRLVDGSADALPPQDFDPKLSSIEFSFKVECPADFDCKPAAECPPEPREQPAIDYLAKDYQGFRRLMLDRLSLLTPDWTERSAADLGVTLVELLAYAADNLSYRQDALATEAYLATARKRVSVRRHARLVDYTLHEGCNARVFVHFDVEAPALLPRGTELLTRAPELPAQIVESDPAKRAALVTAAAAHGALVFESAHDAELAPEQNLLHFYTWGDRGCCLPRGATRATLRTQVRSLGVGSILIFEEALSPSPTTDFAAADRDLTRRCAVRLTKVTFTEDPSGQLFEPTPVDAPLPITELEWSQADALPFPLCLSVEERPELAISVAFGNVVLADHGVETTADLGEVPPSTLERARRAAADGCADPKPDWIPPRFRPTLPDGPLTHAFPLSDYLAELGDPERFRPASSLLALDARSARPVAELFGTLPTGTESWTPRSDLLASHGDDRHFVVEVEDTVASLRFGDSTHGKRPASATRFTARYRVGNGSVGNVGAEAIAHVLTPVDLQVTGVRNPLPASGGVDPEDIEVARRDAPHAFRVQERAVTPADYAAAAERRRDVQRAAASFRWTGSWHTVFVTADRQGGAEVDAPFAARLRRHLERFRMAGYDLAFDAPRFVSLDLALHVCVKPGFFLGKVLADVRRVLSSDVLESGRLGLFHPDNFTFGTPVYLSRVVAAVHAVAGVDSVHAERFQRLLDPSPTSLEEGVIPMGRLEIARLANNPSFPERGKLELRIGGEK